MHITRTVNIRQFDSIAWNAWLLFLVILQLESLFGRSVPRSSSTKMWLVAHFEAPPSKVRHAYGKGDSPESSQGANVNKLHDSTPPFCCRICLPSMPPAYSNTVKFPSSRLAVLRAAPSRLRWQVPLPCFMRPTEFWGNLRGAHQSAFSTHCGCVWISCACIRRKCNFKEDNQAMYLKATIIQFICTKLLLYENEKSKLEYRW